MSDSKDSTVTYTEVSSPFKDLSDIGSLGVDGLPMMLEDPYVEVPQPVYPKFMPPKDDVLSAEEQPLPAALLPTADSPADYPTDNDDDDCDELSDDDEDDDDDVEEDEDKEEEEEHPASADSVLPPVHRVTARIYYDPAESRDTIYFPSTTIEAGVSEVTLPPRKRLYIALGPRYKVGESSSAPTTRPIGGFRADYGFVSTLDDEIRRDPEREDTYEIYGRLDDAQDDRLLMNVQLNMLRRDRCTHARTARVMENEARL
ncbi:hypothetical protein Tco_0178248 [Tanacetum coccineum]